MIFSSRVTKIICHLQMVTVILVISFCSVENHQRTLVIGDSNGTKPDNWVVQLQKLRPQDTFLNLSIAGNTIGFSNNGQDTLNTLENIERYLLRGEENLKKIDRIILLIGTNDCKAVFDSLQKDVPTNLDNVFHSIINHYRSKKLHIPQIFLVTPPPMAGDSLLDKKYFGGEARIRNLILPFKAVAQKYESQFINLHDSLESEYYQLNTDGVHLNEKGYSRIASIINNYIDCNMQDHK